MMRLRRAGVANSVALAVSTLVTAAWPQPGSSGSPSAGSAEPSARALPSAEPMSSSSAPPAKTWSSCSEYLPDGAVRPKLETHLPPRGLSGYELRLLVIVSHGRGETVLPAGFHLERASDGVRALEQAKFHIPEPDGGSPPIIDRPGEQELRDEKKTTFTTTLSLPFVALPEKAGRHALILPPLPIAVGRANGQVMTLCTEAVPITIEDPIANEADPKVHPNPPPRPQREEWLFLKQLVMAAVLVLVLAAFGAWLIARARKRAKPVRVKPTVPPWITAMRELEEIRASRLLEDGQLDVFVDRVNDCVRRYLGERYGFDGLESTSEEIRELLKRVYPKVTERPTIEAFLDDTDLVKFAKVTVAQEECQQVLARAEHIVTATVPPRVEAQHQARRAA